MTFFFEKTQHPKIFKDTYWGGFSVENAKYDIDEFVSNRNDFVAEYGIRTYQGGGKGELSGLSNLPMFDHLELYWNDGGFILVNSPYGDKSAEMTELGFNEVPQMYAPDAKSYVKQFSIKKDIEKFTASLIR